MELDSEPNFDEWVEGRQSVPIEFPEWDQPVEAQIIAYVHEYGRLPKPSTIRCSPEEFEAVLTGMRDGLTARLDVAETVAAETARR